VTCAVYARECGLLEEEGWKWFKGIAKRHQSARISWSGHLDIL
jgi:hypothetical protein